MCIRDRSESKTSDLNECLESTITIAWNELKYRAELVRNYGELPLVYCNPQQLNQVFLNLLINAAHAVEKKGRMGKITVTSRMAGDWIEVMIEDDGCGIPPEVQGRIFEPFFTTKEPGKGTGLGLSISYDIVKKHGGEIAVASTMGEGSLFTVRIPLKPAE
jgi:two-component system NtrC family sensor kinase